MDDPKKQEVVLNDVEKPGNWFYEEDGKSVTKYVFLNVIVPTIKKLVVDTVTNAVNVWLYGADITTKKSNSSKYSWGGSNIINYNDISKNNQPKPIEKVRLSVFDYENVSFRNRGIAELVLSEMTEILDKYPVVTVADFLDICTSEYAGQVANARTSEPTDHNYGWADLSTAKVAPTWNGDFVIKFPKVKVKG